MLIDEPNNNKYLKYSAALTHFPKFGPSRLKKINKYFANAEEAFRAGADDLVKAGIEDNLAMEFILAKDNINPDDIMARLNKENIKIITLTENIYPKLLKEIYNPPPLLYYKGELIVNECFSLAVVGSRKFSSYGKMAAEKIIGILSQNNLTITSGLALGIDAIAHLTALEAGGRTIAVLGSGLDKENIYPSANRYLADKIISSGGTIISEFPIGTPPLKHNFPQRNRLIAGISIGTLVIEADEKSGALITARYALEQNREVFAVPGSIFSNQSRGTNKLIKQGAIPITAAEDIIEALNLDQATGPIDKKNIVPQTPEEEKIFLQLSHEPMHIDELMRLTKLDTSKINSTLTIMEMKGLVKNLGGMQYVIKN